MLESSNVIIQFVFIDCHLKLDIKYCEILNWVGGNHSFEFSFPTYRKFTVTINNLTKDCSKYSPISSLRSINVQGLLSYTCNCRCEGISTRQLWKCSTQGILVTTGCHRNVKLPFLETCIEPALALIYDHHVGWEKIMLHHCRFENRCLWC